MLPSSSNVSLLNTRARTTRGAAQAVGVASGRDVLRARPHVTHVGRGVASVRAQANVSLAHVEATTMLPSSSNVSLLNTRARTTRGAAQAVGVASGRDVLRARPRVTHVGRGVASVRAQANVSLAHVEAATMLPSSSNVSLLNTRARTNVGGVAQAMGVTRGRDVLRARPARDPRGFRAPMNVSLAHVGAATKLRSPSNASLLNTRA
jgi:hypothetical protein